MKNTSASSGATGYYLSERAWLDHLRMMAELPYPSWLLIPSLAKVLRAHLDWDLIILGWDEKETLQPTDLWAEPVRGELFQRYMSSLGQYVEEVPIRPLLETRGRIFRMAETHPDYEKSMLYREFFEPYGVRWGVVIPIYLGEEGLAFLALMRRREGGRYTDADQDRLDRVSEALSVLDRKQNPLAGLPPAGFQQSQVATMLLGRDGRIAAQTQEARNILFMARHTGLGFPEWIRSDWHALPPEVVTVAESLWACQEGEPTREVRMRLAWGEFDFLLERVALNFDRPEVGVNVVMRHHEPLDITVARKLWGWSLSPQEKRIVVASARNPSLSELADALDLSLGTLKHYINGILNRMNVDSRQELIDKILVDAVQG